jgi:hypothetical protein
MKKFKRADPSRAEMTMNRVSQRATSISSSPTGEQVGCLIGGEEPCQVDDAGLLVLGPGHGLEKADAGLNAGVDEEQESDGEEVEGIAGGADGTREIESV